MNYNAMINLAFSEVRGVCRHLLQAYDRMNSPRTPKADKSKFTRMIDDTIQDMLVQALKAKYKDHLFVAEESREGVEQSIPDHPAVWVIDPIDGSHNYQHHIPFFSISICFYHKGEPAFALVYDPIQDELFTAIQGSGALLNQHRMEVGRCERLEEAMCGIETQTDIPKLPLGHSVRKMGCMSLSLCYLACGRFDLVICQSPHIWDSAAGILIAQESGAFVYNENFKNYKHGDEYLYVSNQKIRDQLSCQ